MSKNYYRNRIIFTFTVISAIVIMVASRLSYQYVSNIYIDQIQENVAETTNMLSSQIDTGSVKLLEIGPPSDLLLDYLNNITSKNSAVSQKELVIFDSGFTILYSSENFEYGSFEPLFVLNKNVLGILPRDSVVTSTPFKDKNHQWYLWGFKKLTNGLYLAVRESAKRFDKIDSFSNIAWGVGFVLVIIISGIAYFLAKSITRPISKLIEYSVEVSNGNHSIEMPDHYKGELKILSGSVEKMKKSLIQQQKDREHLLAQIAHEIRNPLGGIELLINLVKEGNQNQTHITYFNKIQNEISRLKHLINSFLNFSKPDTASPEWFLISDVADRVFETLKPQIEKKQIFCKLEFGFIKIYYDKTHLYQILLNLIHNSIEAVEEKGEIIIQSYIKDRYWFVEVKDSGPGIDKDNYEKLFAPFFTTKKNGTGLGLAISKKLAVENKGDILISKNGYFSVIIKKEMIDEKL